MVIPGQRSARPAAIVNVGSIRGKPVDSMGMIGLAFNWPKREVP
jgi:hypothetical protein